MKLIVVLFCSLLSVNRLNATEEFRRPSDTFLTQQDVTRVQEQHWNAKYQMHFRKSRVTRLMETYIFCAWDGTTFPVQRDYPHHPLNEKQYPMLPDNITSQNLKRRSSENSMGKNEKENNKISLANDEEI
jgi:hypothetical protein